MVAADAAAAAADVPFLAGEEDDPPPLAAAAAPEDADDGGTAATTTHRNDDARDGGRNLRSALHACPASEGCTRACRCGAWRPTEPAWWCCMTDGRIFEKAGLQKGGASSVVVVRARALGRRSKVRVVERVAMLHVWS